MNPFIRFSLIILIAWTAFSTAQGQNERGLHERIARDVQNGPSIRQYRREADKAFEREDYFSATYFYDEIVKRDSNDIEAWRKMALSADFFGNYQYARKGYRMLVERFGGDTARVEDQMRLAYLEYRLGDYKTSEKYYRLVLDRTPPPPAHVRTEAKGGLTRSQWAQSVDSTDLVVAPLDEHVNDTMWSEFAPYIRDSVLYYTSYSFPYVEGFRERLKMNVMHAPLAGDSFEQGTPLNINSEKAHTAYLAYNDKGDRRAFSRCRYEQKSLALRCDLCMQSKKTDGTWTDPVKIPGPINDKEGRYTSTEPTFGYVPGKTSQPALYFSSDRPGSRKLDLYYAPLFQDSAGAPVALSLVNTPGDEVTPFYDVRTHTLYFSSDSLPTLGGFDMYRLPLGKGLTRDSLLHLEKPLNSGGNDVFYYQNETGRKVYFSSNRNGLQHAGVEDCCYDLYQAGRPLLVPVTFHALTGDSLRGTELQLVQMKDGKPREDIKVKLSDKDASFTFAVSPETDYRVIATKENFQPDTVDLRTPRALWEKPIAVRLDLRPLVFLRVHVLAHQEKDGRDVQLNGAKVVVKDLGASTSTALKPRPDQVSIQPDTNLHVFAIDFGRRYNVKATHEGYTEKEIELNTEKYTEPTIIDTTLVLYRGVRYTAYVFEKGTNKPLTGIHFKLRGLKGDPYTRELTNATGNTFRDTLEFDKRYELSASLSGYSLHVEPVSTQGLPKVPFHELNDTFYLCRPLDCLLPITLYFDNDQPNFDTKYYSIFGIKDQPIWKDYPPKPENDTVLTRKIFFDNAVSYVKGIPEYTAYYKKIRQDTNIIYNFLDEVSKSNAKLVYLSDTLVHMLERGDTITLNIRGFASPLGNSAYNKILTARRIESVIKHFIILDSRALGRYIDWQKYFFVVNRKGIHYETARIPDRTAKPKVIIDEKTDFPQIEFITDSTKKLIGQLTINVDPAGVDTSGEKVLGGRDAQIYSLQAAQKRRIEIKSVDVRPYIPKPGDVQTSNSSN